MDSIIERFCFGSAPALPHAYDPFDPRRPISHEEQLYRFGNAALPLYYQAERARRRGISWRHFCVGCAVWAFREDASLPQDRWRAFYGMNTKVAEHSRNICAEPIPLNAAYAYAYTEIIGLVVVGNPQEDERGQKPRTLRPCIHCRTLMKHHPLMRPHTIIITAVPPPRDIDSLDEVDHEVFTFAELLAEYGET